MNTIAYGQHFGTGEGRGRLRYFGGMRVAIGADTPPEVLMWQRGRSFLGGTGLISSSLW